MLQTTKSYWYYTCIAQIIQSLYLTCIFLVDCKHHVHSHSDKRLKKKRCNNCAKKWYKHIIKLGIVRIYSILTNITKGTRPFCGIVANTPKSFINTFSMKAAWSWNALVTLYSLPTNFTCTLVWAYTVSMFPTT